MKTVVEMENSGVIHMLKHNKMEGLLKGFSFTLKNSDSGNSRNNRDLKQRERWRPGRQKWQQEVDIFSLSVSCLDKFVQREWKQRHSDSLCETWVFHQARHGTSSCYSWRPGLQHSHCLRSLMKLMLLYENYILFFLANKRRVRNLEEGEGERMRGYKGRAGCQSPPPLWKLLHYLWATLYIRSNTCVNGELFLLYLWLFVLTYVLLFLCRFGQNAPSVHQS